MFDCFRITLIYSPIHNINIKIRYIYRIMKPFTKLIAHVFNNNSNKIKYDNSGNLGKLANFNKIWAILVIQAMLMSTSFKKVCK